MGNPLDYNKSYKTYDEFMAKIEDDLSTYADQGFIEADKYIDVVDKCNAFLSIKVNPTRTVKLEVKNYKVKLPSDFKLWYRGFICHSVTTVKEPILTSKTTRVIKTECETSDWIERNEHAVMTITTEQGEVIKMEDQVPLVLTQPHYVCADCGETNLYGAEVAIERDGDDLYLLTGFETATIIISFVTKLISPEDILIYDHPLVREYYEYAVKERIFEDIWLNGKEEVFRRYQLATEKHRQAKIEAKRFVNTPDFREIRSYYVSKRRRMYEKYYKPLLEKTQYSVLYYNSYTDIYPSYYKRYNNFNH
jgi:hypothetical protein